MTVEFDIQPRALRVGEAATATFTIRGADNPPAPQLPAIPGIQASPPSRQSLSQMRFENGHYTSDSSIIFNYRLLPISPGTFQVGPFKYSAGGQTVEIPAVEMRVVPGDAAPGQTAGTQGGPALLAKLSAEQTAVYNQQAFDLYITLYARGIRLGREIGLLNLPSSGLELGPQQELQPTREVVNNEVYDVWRFRYKARALTAGTFRLEPTLRVNVLVQRDRRRRSPFGDMFGDDMFQGFPDLFGGVEQQPVNLQPDPLEIVVKPLPEEGRPESFSGAVGEFSFDVNVKPTELQIGEPVTVTMTITGAGNIESITAPPLDLGDDFKVYEPRLVTKNVDPARSAGQKVFEEVVLPKTPQANALPPIAFAYFNPKTGRYETIARGPFALTLHAASNAAARMVQAPHAAAAQTRVLGVDIVYLKPAPQRWRRATDTPWFESRAFLGLQVLPVAAAAALFFSVRRRKSLAQDVARARRQRAPRSARSALRKAEHALHRRDTAAFYEAVWEALASYFGDRLNLAPGEVSADLVTAALSKGRLPDADVEALRGLFQRCELARFGQRVVGSDDQDMRGILDDLGRLLRACERVRL
ncbi:MAG: protein BatD [Kiritimatiellae bacterium]|nr:protein BatD [Kiritimatiellia bacterium]